MSVQDSAAENVGAAVSMALGVRLRSSSNRNKPYRKVDERKGCLVKHHSDQQILDWLEEHANEINVLQYGLAQLESR